MKIRPKRILNVLTIILALSLSISSYAQNDLNKSLLSASKRGHTQLILNLIQQGADVNTTNDEGQTPLMLASEGGYLEAVKVLIFKGAKLSIQDKRKWTAIYYAGHRQHVDVLQYLYAEAEKRVVTKTMIFDMTWRYGEQSKSWPNSKHIILNFVDFPNHHIGIYSPDLGAYLESLNSKTVPVTYEVTFNSETDRVIGYNEVKIGKLTKWQSDWGYGGRVGDYDPAPWYNYKEKQANPKGN